MMYMYIFIYEIYIYIYIYICRCRLEMPQEVCPRTRPPAPPPLGGWPQESGYATTSRTTFLFTEFCLISPEFPQRYNFYYKFTEFCSFL